MDNVLIDAVLALIALLVGFFSALWYVKHAAPTAQRSGEEDLDAIEKEEKANDAERASMAALQLRDLAKNVATDVGAHNNLVSDISDELGNLSDGADVSAVVDRILAANEKLQNRLVEAEAKDPNASRRDPHTTIRSVDGCPDEVG